MAANGFSHEIESDDRQRTQDVYEHIASFPKPPLPALPSWSDRHQLVDLGLDKRLFKQAGLRLGLAVAGFGRFKRAFARSLEETLRTTDPKRDLLFPAAVSATLALADDRRSLSPAQRAATLILAARALHDDLAAGKLPPDEHRGRPLEMGQYPNLFSTSLVIENGSNRLFKSPRRSHAAIIFRGRFFLLQIEGESIRSAASLTRAIEEIARTDTASGSPATPVGVLTAAPDNVQYEAFSDALKNPANARSLRFLRHSFITVCLDFDRAPADAAEAAMLAQCGNFANRWFHSSLQLVVFGNARAAAICAYRACLDGNTMVRGAAEIQNRAALIDVTAGAAPSASTASDRDGEAFELQWDIDPAHITKAQAELDKICDDEPRSTFEIPVFGSSGMDDAGFAAVPVFVVALVIAVRRMRGATPIVGQFLSRTGYRCVDSMATIVTSDDVKRFAEYFEREQQRDPEQARTLLAKAVRSQQEHCRVTRRTLPLWLLIEYFTAQDFGQKRFVARAALKVVKRLKWLEFPGFDILISHPAIRSETPLIGRPGIRLPYLRFFGLHYQIFSDRTVLTIARGTDWKIGNAAFVAELTKNLSALRALIAPGRTAPATTTPDAART